MSHADEQRVQDNFISLKLWHG